MGAINKERLRAQLRSNARTYEWLGMQLGVSSATVCMWVSGRRSPKPVRVPEIAAALGCSVEFLTAPQERPSPMP